MRRRPAQLGAILRRAAQFFGAIPLTRRRSSRYCSYASYYFQLRTLCQRENNGQEPALKPMDMEKAQALEARGLSKTAELKKSAGKTWQSANDVDSSAAGGLGSLAGAAMRGPL